MIHVYIVNFSSTRCLICSNLDISDSLWLTDFNWIWLCFKVLHSIFPGKIFWSLCSEHMTLDLHLLKEKNSVHFRKVCHKYVNARPHKNGDWLYIALMGLQSFFKIKTVETWRSTWRCFWSSSIVPPSATSPSSGGSGSDSMAKTRWWCREKTLAWTLVEYINFALWVEGYSFTVGEVDEDPTTSVQPHLPSITTPEPDPATTPTADREPEPRDQDITHNGHHAWAKAHNEVSASCKVHQEEKPEYLSDKLCELAVTSMPVEVLVELEEEE